MISIGTRGTILCTYQCSHDNNHTYYLGSMHTCLSVLYTSRKLHAHIHRGSKDNRYKSAYMLPQPRRGAKLPKDYWCGPILELSIHPWVVISATFYKCCDFR